jgi:hypothetical protein
MLILEEVIFVDLARYWVLVLDRVHDASPVALLNSLHPQGAFYDYAFL